MPEESPTPWVGREVGPFRVVSVLGHGGMGVVYRAEHASSGARVALKTVGSVAPTYLGALRSEISSLGAIRHPGVVRVIDHGVNGGLPWYAMELIEGRTLADFNRELWLADGDRPTVRTTTTSTGRPSAAAASDLDLADFGFDPTRLAQAQPSPSPPPEPRPPAAAGQLAEALAFYAALCVPLAYLHARGIVHRDLKPANIFLRADGTPVVVDFGLVSYARGTIGRESLPSGVPGLGTVGYVSPEQILGVFADARADLYALGCMLYETITGRPPFAGDRKETLSRHLAQPPLPPSELVSGVAPELDALVLGLLAKAPQDRIGYAADVATMLAELGGTEAPALEAQYLYRPQIVGRQNLLEVLVDRGSRARAAGGGVVLLGGESGIGKTFLVAELARGERQRGRRVVTGECVPVGADAATVTEFSGGPLHPLRRLLRAIADECQRGGAPVRERLLGTRASLLAEYEPALAPFVDSAGEQRPKELPPAAARVRVLECLADTLAAFSDYGPLVLILDDLQWSDELTLAFLKSLAPAFFASRSLLIVGTYRVEDVGPDLGSLLEAPAVERLAVGRLDGGTVEAIARDMLGMKSPPATLVRFLGDRAEGNPFFIAEYLRLLVAEGILTRRKGKWAVSSAVGGDPDFEYATLGVPRSLEGIVNRRLSGLGAAARRVIEAAAVLGREFPLGTLSAICGLDRDALLAALGEGKSRQVVEEVDEGHHRFSHDKLRETAYAGSEPERRRELHRLAALTIEKKHAGSPDLPRYFADLARHYKQAGNAAKTIEYLEKAGSDALAKSANREAVNFLKDAIEQTARLGSRPESLRLARWHREISDGLQALGQLDDSAEYLRRAARLLGKPAPRNRKLLIVSLLANVVRQAMHRLFPRLFLPAARLTATANATALGEAALVHHRLQQVLYYSGDAPAMLHACISSLNLAEQSGLPENLTAAYSNAFAVAGILPARKLADSYRRRANETNDRQPGTAIECDLRMLSGGYSMGVADWDDAQRELGRGLALAADLGYRRAWEDCCMVAAVCDYLRGDFGQALARSNALYESALRGDRQTQSWGLVQRAYVLLAQDRLDEALASLRRAERLVGEDQKNRVEYLWLHAALARALLRARDLPGARVTAARAYARMVQSPPLFFSWIEAFGALAEVCSELLAAPGGSAAERARLRREAHRLARTMDAQARVFPAAGPQRHLWQGTLAWRLGKPRGAVRSWQRALAAARELRMPYEEASALRALGQARPAGDPEGQLLQSQARDIFRTLAAEYDLAQTERPSR